MEWIIEHPTTAAAVVFLALAGAVSLIAFAARDGGDQLLRDARKDSLRQRMAAADGDTSEWGV